MSINFEIAPSDAELQLEQAPIASMSTASAAAIINPAGVAVSSLLVIASKNSGGAYTSSFTIFAGDVVPASGVHEPDHEWIEEAGMGWDDAINMYIAKQFGGYLALAARDKISSGVTFDRSKIVDEQIFRYNPKDYPIYIETKAYNQSDGSFWIDINSNGHPETHIQTFPDGLWYDSDLNGTYDTRINDSTFLL